MEKACGKALWCHSFQQWRQTFGDREEIHVYMHTVLYKASTSEIPSLLVLMKRTGPVGLQMGHTSWKGSANSSFCKKRKMNSKWAFLKPFVRWLFNAQHMSTALTAGQLQLWETYPVKEGSEGTGEPHFYLGKKIKQHWGLWTVLLYSQIWGNPFLQAVILQ